MDIAFLKLTIVAHINYSHWIWCIKRFFFSDYGRAVDSLWHFHLAGGKWKNDYMQAFIGDAFDGGILPVSMMIQENQPLRNYSINKSIIKTKLDSLLYADLKTAPECICQYNLYENHIRKKHKHQAPELKSIAVLWLNPRNCWIYSIVWRD